MANSNNSIDSTYTYIKAIVLLIVYLASLYEAQAQVHLVKDINTDPQWSYWASTAKQMGNAFYFNAYSNQYGNELWKSDGTTGGTVLLKDINPGTNNSSPQKLTVASGTLFFVADDGVHGAELWRSDGTPGGTYLLKDLQQGAAWSNFMEMVAVDDQVYFTTIQGNKYQLWRSDGTDVNFVIDMGYIQGLTAAGNVVYFAGNGSGEGELWRSEGTDETTFIVKDITGSNVNTGPRLMTNVNGIIYFVAYKQGTGIELWKTDGTDAGTVIVADINPNEAHSYPDNFVASGNKLYFTADDGSKGRELWVTDGTSTQMVIDITNNSGSTEFGEMIGANGSLYFVANAPSIGKELWKTDGTTIGTYAVEDIAAGTAGSTPSNLTLANGMLFFSADDNERGRELWKTDSAGETVTIVKEIYDGDSSNPSGLFAFNNNLYFWANDGVHGSEIWVSTSSGETRLLKDLATGTGFSTISSLVVDGNHAWFTDYNTGIWRTDGTNDGTVNIREQMGQTYKLLLKTEDKLYAVAHIPEFDTEQILCSNGTEELLSLHYNTFTSIVWMMEMNGILYIAGEQPGTGMELWKSNGEFGDVTIVSDINPGAQGSFPYAPFIFNDAMYFRADDGTHGSELWVCKNGVVEMVKDISPGPDHGSPQQFFVSNGKIFFNATDPEHGQELWISDGTEGGTHLVKDIREGINWSAPMSFASLNNVVYFVATDEEHGTEVWRTDGTEEGTTLLKDINTVQGNYDSPDYLTVFDGALYFSAGDEEHGYELWKSDGTEEGTHILKDITPGADGTGLWWLTVVNDHLFFIADDKLWRSNGTECSTMPVLDDPTVSYYDAFMPAGYANKLFFTGVSGDAGAELYYYDFSTINDPGCVQTITFEPIGSKTVTDGPFELEATSSAGLEITFESSNEGVIKISGNTATIVGAGEVTITAKQAGNIDYSANTEDQTVQVAAITGLDESVDKKISVYPNPTTDFVMVDVNDSVIDLMDLNGRVLFSTDENKLDVRSLSSGIYMVRITTKEFTVTKRIVKK